MNCVQTAETMDNEIIGEELNENPGFITECMRCKEIEKLFLPTGKPKKIKKDIAISGWSLFRTDCFNSDKYKNISGHIVFSEISKVWKSDAKLRKKYNDEAKELKREKDNLYLINRKIKNKE